MATKQLNQLPAPTFSWLGVNGTTREVPDIPAEQIVIPDSAEPVSTVTVNGPADIDIACGGSQRMVIMQIPAGQAVLHTKIHADSGAHFKLVQIISGGEIIADLQAELADNASLELIQLYLGCKDAVSGIHIDLNGRSSAFSSKIGYALADRDVLDINLNIVQNGRKTVSDTVVKGALRDHAKKTFRGTIDFRNGSAGSAGTEQENVLLLDETVINQTVPVILCAEEDVAGSHGATIGRIDPKQVSYMQSRGIPEAQIVEILAQSQIFSIVQQIGDCGAEQSVYRLLGREFDDE